jgi:ABC-type nickel/cobalt efflux system permease component RcnA
VYVLGVGRRRVERKEKTAAKKKRESSIKIIRKHPLTTINTHQHSPILTNTHTHTHTHQHQQLKEVKNGRLAMIAAAGMILQGVSTHQGALQNFFGN